MKIFRQLLLKILWTFLLIAPPIPSELFSLTSFGTRQFNCGFILLFLQFFRHTLGMTLMIFFAIPLRISLTISQEIPRKLFTLTIDLILFSGNSSGFVIFWNYFGIFLEFHRWFSIESSYDHILGIRSAISLENKSAVFTRVFA